MLRILGVKSREVFLLALDHIQLQQYLHHVERLGEWSIQTRSTPTRSPPLCVCDNLLTRERGRSNIHQERNGTLNDICCTRNQECVFFRKCPVNLRGKEISIGNIPRERPHSRSQRPLGAQKEAKMAVALAWRIVLFATLTTHRKPSVILVHPTSLPETTTGTTTLRYRIIPYDGGMLNPSILCTMTYAGWLK